MEDRRPQWTQVIINAPDEDAHPYGQGHSSRLYDLPLRISLAELHSHRRSVLQRSHPGRAVVTTLASTRGHHAASLRRHGLAGRRQLEFGDLATATYARTRTRTRSWEPSTTSASMRSSAHDGQRTWGFQSRKRNHVTAAILTPRSATATACAVRARPARTSPRLRPSRRGQGCAATLCARPARNHAGARRTAACSRRPISPAAAVSTRTVMASSIAPIRSAAGRACSGSDPDHDGMRPAIATTAMARSGPSPGVSECRLGDRSVGDLGLEWIRPSHPGEASSARSARSSKRGTSARPQAASSRQPLTIVAPPTLGRATSSVPGASQEACPGGSGSLGTTRTESRARPQLPLGQCLENDVSRPPAPPPAVFFAPPLAR